MKLQVLSLGLAMAAFSAVGGETGVPEEATPAAAAGGVPEKAERGMRIDAMEARAARRFGRVDADGDGKVTPEEFAAGRIGGPEGRQGRGERHGDRDGDRRKGGRREHAAPAGQDADRADSGWPTRRCSTRPMPTATAG